MLELRLTADAKRIAAMSAAIRRECRRARAEPEHAASLVLVAERLLGTDDEAGRRRRGERHSEVLVVVTVQSDATMLMVRELRPGRAPLGAQRRDLLDAHATRWSTVCGREGRTVWVEIPRATAVEPNRDVAPMRADPKPRSIPVWSGARPELAPAD
jgi:hypothetical protein